MWDQNVCFFFFSFYLKLKFQRVKRGENHHSAGIDRKKIKLKKEKKNYNNRESNFRGRIDRHSAPFKEFLWIIVVMNGLKLL